MQKLLFIINPVSGIGKQKKIEKLAPQFLDTSKFTFEFVYTSAPKQATRLAQEHACLFDIIVAVGGDGTINEVAAGLIGTSCLMGIIPTGSGNGFARCLGIPCDVSKALKLLNTGKKTCVDTMTCNDNLFVNVGGIGFDAEIGHRFAEQKTRGFFTYLKISLSKIVSYKAQHYEIELNGSKMMVDALMVSFANSTQFGNNVHIAPHAKLNDGLIDVCILRPFPFYAALSIGIKLLRGTIHTSKYMQIVQTDRVTIATTSNQLQIHLDGEPLTIDAPRLLCSVNRLSLNVIAS